MEYNEMGLDEIQRDGMEYNEMGSWGTIKWAKMRYDEKGLDIREWDTKKWDGMKWDAARRGDGMTTNLKCLGTCFIIFLVQGEKKKKHKKAKKRDRSGERDGEGGKKLKKNLEHEDMNK